jgi:hypothetical protein
MYRILADAGETGERRHQLTHPCHARPELLAPSQTSYGAGTSSATRRYWIVRW